MWGFCGGYFNPEISPVDALFLGLQNSQSMETISLHFCIDNFSNDEGGGLILNCMYKQVKFYLCCHCKWLSSTNKHPFHMWIKKCVFLVIIRPMTSTFNLPIIIVMLLQIRSLSGKNGIFWSNQVISLASLIKSRCGLICVIGWFAFKIWTLMY
jgi:hypothetical protein